MRRAAASEIRPVVLDYSVTGASFMRKCWKAKLILGKLRLSYGKEQIIFSRRNFFHGGVFRDECFCR
jgi:hypothetical protein